MRYRLGVGGLHLEGLIQLRKEGVQGRFLGVLISMYSNDKSAVKIDNKLTEAFTCFAGVKQGCMMSPILFLIAI